MAGEFFNCVLRAAGKAPPGGGGDPPGGGKGGPGPPDPGDGGSPGDCYAQATYTYCDFPQTFGADQPSNCNAQVTFSKFDLVDSGNLNTCLDAFPDILNLNGLNYYRIDGTFDGDAACEAQPYCHLDPFDCDAYVCPNELSDPSETPCDWTTVNILDAINCGAAVDQGLNSECPKTGLCFLNNKNHWFNDQECNDFEPACNADDTGGGGPNYCVRYKCEDPGCPEGTCQAEVINENHARYDDLCGPDFEDGDFGYYLDQATCEQSDDCVVDIPCTYYPCVASDCKDGAGGDCCPEITVAGSGPNKDTYCNCGVYNGPGYNTKAFCEEACIPCPDGYVCPDDDEGVCGVSEELCDGKYDSNSGECVYDPACYASEAECYADPNACDACPSIWLCVDPDNSNPCVEYPGDKQPNGSCYYAGAPAQTGFSDKPTCVAACDSGANKCYQCTDSDTCDATCDPAGWAPDTGYYCDESSCFKVNLDCVNAGNCPDCYRCPTDFGSCTPQLRVNGDCVPGDFVSEALCNANCEPTSEYCYRCDTDGNCLQDCLKDPDTGCPDGCYDDSNCLGECEAEPPKYWICESTGICDDTCIADETGQKPDYCYDTEFECENDPDAPCVLDNCWVCPEGPGFKPCIKTGLRDANGNCINGYETIGECYAQSECNVNFRTGTGLESGQSGGGARDSNGFTRSDLASIYDEDFVDTQYERGISNRRYATAGKFRPVSRGSLDALLFNKAVHASVLAVYLMNKGAMAFSDIPYHDLGDTVLERSLNSELVEKYRRAKKADGDFMIGILLSQVRDALLCDRLDQLHYDELKKLVDNVLKAQNDPKFEKTRGSAPVYTAGIGSESQAVSLALEKAYSLNPEDYESVLAQEKMKLWKTVAGDLRKYIPIKLADGTETKLYINDDDSFVTTTSAGDSSGYISDGDRLDFTKEDGSPGQLIIKSDLQRAGVLDFEAIQRVIKLLGEDYKIRMRVETAEANRIEELYGVTKERRDFFFLQLDPTTLQDLDAGNLFIRKTQVTYDLISNESDRDDWVKSRPWPYLILNVDADDPILSFLADKQEAIFEFLDFTFDQFSDVEEGLPVFPRRIPWTIVLIPTDIDSELVSHSVSKYITYGTRQIDFIIHPDPNQGDLQNAPHVESYYPYPDRGVYLENNPQQTFYRFKRAEVAALTKYKEGSPRLPRPKFGMRQMLRQLSDLREYYDLGLDSQVSWEEVFDRMDKSKIKYLYQECFDWDKVKYKANRGKLSTDDSVNLRYAIPRDIRSTLSKITDSFQVTRTEVQLLDDGVEPTEPEELE